MEKNLLSIKISDFIVQRAKARLEKFDKDAAKSLKAVDDDSALEVELAAKRLDEAAKYTPEIWLTHAAQRAKQINMVTHALKYSHSDAKGTSILVTEQGIEAPLLTTSSLSTNKTDVVGNAAALDVAALLKLEANGEVLVNLIATNDASALKPFAKDEQQLDNWMIGFQQALTDKSLSSHSLAKQLYFPVDNSYHLLSPLFASSFAGQIHTRLQDSFYSDEAKSARTARRENRYHPKSQVSYPEIAVQTFGGTKPQNISQLNSGRGGRSYLLSCQPPKWQKLSKPPTGKNDFWYEYERRTWRITKSLKNYLERIVKKTSTKPRRDRRAQMVDELIDIFFVYAAEIRSLKESPSWSADSELTMAEKLFLDPQRAETDEAFKLERERNEWQQEIASQFARWLNNKLKSDKLPMSDVEYDEWSRLVKRKQVAMRDDLEVML